MSFLSDLKGFTADLKAHRARIDAVTVEAIRQAAFWEDSGHKLAVSAKRVGIEMDRIKEWLSK